MIKIQTCLALTLSVGMANVALAHDQWDDGQTVPNWVKSQCCGLSDAHHLRAEQVHVIEGGYRLDGYGEVLPENRLQPSPDGSWWVFYRTYPDGTQSSVYCFFGPESGS